MHRIIRYGSVLFFAIGLLFSSGVAEAHVLKEDNGYSAVLHIDPDDEPLAGQPTRLNFLMDSQNGGFSQNSYHIGLVIMANGKVLQRSTVEPAEFGDAGDGIATFTFPSLNVYTLTLNGVLASNNSQQFHMVYLVRVAGSVGADGNVTASQAASNGAQVVILSAGSLAILGLISFAVINQGKRYAPKPAPISNRKSPPKSKKSKK
jgi:hypothetical protein